MSFKGAFEPPCNYCNGDHSVLDCDRVKYDLTNQGDHLGWCSRVDYAIEKNNHLMMKALYRQASAMIEHGMPYDRPGLIKRVNAIVNKLEGKS